MLFASCKIADKYNYLEEKFTCAYKWLLTEDLAALPVGSYEILGKTVIANVQEYTTFPEAECFFETHDAYFDIQYVVSGREQFGICKREGLIVRESKPENDVVFYEEPEYSGSVFLGEGDLVVVAPEDAHKPRCQAGGPCAVKKIVIKVAL